MIRYAEFKPCQLDPPGLGRMHMGPNQDEDHGEWLVATVARNRESDPVANRAFGRLRLRLERSVGPEGADWEIHRMRHWGFGWFEIILVRPGSRAEKVAGGA